MDKPDTSNAEVYVDLLPSEIAEAYGSSWGAIVRDRDTKTPLGVVTDESGQVDPRLWGSMVAENLGVPLVPQPANVRWLRGATGWVRHVDAPQLRMEWQPRPGRRPANRPTTNAAPREA